jgi:hypothetical protein
VKLNKYIQKLTDDVEIIKAVLGTKHHINALRAQKNLKPFTDKQFVLSLIVQSVNLINADLHAMKANQQEQAEQAEKAGEENVSE